MNKILKFFPAALAVVALASCSSDDLFGGQNNLTSNGKHTVEANIESLEATTRSAFAEINNEASTRRLVWSAGDAYKQYGELAIADKYVLQTASAGKSSGTFELQNADDYNDNPTIALYPYSDANVMDRASKTVTINLPQTVTYSEIEVNDEGYEDAIGYVANAPMIGSYKEGAVNFLYMTALLKVDLSTLPKNTYALEITTDRPLYGNFSVTVPDGEITASNCPEIVSTPGDGGEYVLTVNTTAEAKRTNKTFFIPVPTGNKYKKFDIKVLYRMAGVNKSENIAQLGNDDRGAANALKWNRGKVKSLTRSITVTSGGNTPAAISAFLKDECGNFPEGNDIVIDVTDGEGAAADLKCSASDWTITIPAALKNRNVKINVAASNRITDNLQIFDEDPAPVPGKSLRSIEICAAATSGKTLTINAPESQVIVSAPEGKEAAWKSIEATTANEDNGEIGSGLTLGEGVKLEAAAANDELLTINGGGLLIDKDAVVGSGSNTGKVIVNGNDDVVVKSTAAKAFFQLKGNSSIMVEGADADHKINVQTISMAWAPSNDKSTPSTGNITVKNATVGGIYSETTGNISFENTDDVKVWDSCQQGSETTPTGKGNPTISVKNAASITGIYVGSIAANKAITIDGVGATTALQTNGKNAITMTNVKANITALTANNEENAAKVSITAASDKAITVSTLTYAGQGDVEISATAGKEFTLGTLSIPAAGTDALKAKQTGSVTLTNMATATSIEKNTTGELNITGLTGNAATITNKAGNVNITGNSADGKTPQVDTKLTQSGNGNITLKDLSCQAANQGVKEIALGADAVVNISYENTAIGEITGTTCTKDMTTNVVGTKASALLKVLPTITKRTFKPSTDAWDGVSYAKDETEVIYTSGSFAALSKTTKSSATVYVDIDLNGKNFNNAAPLPANLKWGIASAVTSLTGQTNTAGAPATTIKGLVANTGLFNTPTTSTSISNFIIDSPKILGNHDAGVIVGATTKDLAVTNVQIKNAEINTSKNYAGSAINFGGIVGAVNGGTSTIDKVTMNQNTIHGHYYMGGIIGAIGSATKVEIKNTQTTGTKFDVQSADGKWNTKKSGTVAPFIGGLTGSSVGLSINTCQYNETTDYSGWHYTDNFLLDDESYVFQGTNRTDTKFIGYVEGTTSTYYLKLMSGFEATNMTKWNETTKLAAVDTNYNVFVKE